VHPLALVGGERVEGMIVHDCFLPHAAPAPRTPAGTKAAFESTMRFDSISFSARFASPLPAGER
jgi:hypothetical protein